MLGMKVREHSKILDWPPQSGGTNGTAEHPQAESQAVVKEVHVSSVQDHSVPLSSTFKGNVFTYDVVTKDPVFARKLAAEFSKYVGHTLEQFGNLDIDF
jgi:hypothetical protein